MIEDELSDEERERLGRRDHVNRESLRAVLTTRNGRRFLWSMFQRAGYGQNAFTFQREATDFNCGRQSVAAELRIEMEAIDRNAYINMITEAQEDNDYVNGTNPDTDDAGHSNSLDLFQQPKPNVG
jgi:hypothetical protein